MGLNTQQTGFFVHAGAVEDVPCTVTFTDSANLMSFTVSSGGVEWGPSRAEIMRRTARLIFGDIC